MAGRTLTQYAVPVTFGLVAAQWLAGVLDAPSAVEARRDDAAGAVWGSGRAPSLLTADLVADPVAAVAAGWPTTLGLTWPGLPWHTHRTPVTRLGDALVETCDAWGLIAGDVLQLGPARDRRGPRAAAAGRGGSSTMPHKQNPVLSVLVRSGRAAGAVAGGPAAPSSALRRRRATGRGVARGVARRCAACSQLTVGAAAQAAELVARLEVARGP